MLALESSDSNDEYCFCNNRSCSRCSFSGDRVGMLNVVNARTA
eukprot:CAMPEP_0183723546 /NCGR_PEP_ID=MMETSP0737-20130205/15793_1 /TAXON_ID=385413 /ORGANISM="Thalassiosira miniscula, Strain CCMP1093" /LENGTH=42 /DNA_ID= /DNA_START= /DNA_END= /DNA_ORIENTATION=